MGRSKYIDRTGEEKVMNNGQKAKIVTYRSYKDIDIEFEDGILVEHRTYRNFKKGIVINPNYNLYSKLGEERIMNNGQKAKIKVYRNAKDIDIEFEDGTLVAHKSYGNFKIGNISNPNYKSYERRVGEERVMNNGQKAKILAYRNCTDIDVEFEDGTLVEHKSYGDFKKGLISNPNYNYNSKYKLGEERIMNNGQKAKILVYRNCFDIDVEFEDGTLVKHKNYKYFKTGEMKNPNYNLYSKLGEERIMNNGQKAKIVAYRSYTDIDIEFEDRTLVAHKSYGNFKIGNISNPNYNSNSKLGEERVMNNGQKAKILVYRNCFDIDVEFEDRTLVAHKSYSNFKKGNISNPNLNPKGKLGNFRIVKKVFANRDKETQEIKFVLWQCKCERCGYENLITPQMMLKHKC